MTWSPGCEPRACFLPGVPLAARCGHQHGVVGPRGAAPAVHPAEGPSAPALLSGVQGRWLLWRLAAEGWTPSLPHPPTLPSLGAANGSPDSSAPDLSPPWGTALRGSVPCLSLRPQLC